jgi:hypothetical protein
MPDLRVTELTAIDTVMDADLVMVIDDPSGTPFNKKATVAQVLVNTAKTNASNTFTGDQTVDGDLFVTGEVNPVVFARQKPKIDQFTLPVGGDPAGSRTLLSRSLISGLSLRHDEALAQGRLSVGNYDTQVYQPLLFEVESFQVHTGVNPGNRVERLRVHPTGGVTVGTVHTTDPGVGVLVAGGLGTTPLNASQLLSGIVANARLTADVLRVVGGFPGGTATYLRADGTFATPPAGAGDVVGPASAVTTNLAVFSGTTGKLIADGGQALVNIPKLDVANTFTQLQTIANDLILDNASVAKLRFGPAVAANPMLKRSSSTLEVRNGTDTAFATFRATLTAGDITSGTLPNARIQLSASPRLLGRGTAAAGAMEEIVLGSGLAMVGTTLFGTVSVPATVAYKDQTNTFTMNQLIWSGGYAGLELRDTTPAVDARSFWIGNKAGVIRFEAYNDNLLQLQSTPLVLHRNGNVTMGGALTLDSVTPRLFFNESAAAVGKKQWLMVAEQEVFTFQLAQDNGTPDAVLLQITRTGDTLVNGTTVIAGNVTAFGTLTCGGAIFEQWRTVAMGIPMAENIDLMMPYYAGANVSGTYYWSIVGKTLFLNVYGIMSIMAGVGAYTIDMPGNYTPAVSSYHPCSTYDSAAGGGWLSVFVAFWAGTKGISVYRPAQAAWGASTNHFTIMIPVMVN